jgi:hypothetical protein
MTETHVDEAVTVQGEWVVPTVSDVEPKRRFCALCGRPIARPYWRAAPAGEPLVFCEPAHADLYATYWLPVHGGQSAATTAGGVAGA